MSEKADRNIGILGCGNWGTTLANIAASNVEKVYIWGRNPEVINEINEKHENPRYAPGLKISENVVATDDLGKVADECELIVVVLPSKVFRESARKLGDHIHGGHVLVSATKGIEGESFKLMTDILKEETCSKKIGVLSGPNLAKEIQQGNPAAAVVASEFTEVIERMRDVFHTSKFLVYGNRDVTGVQIGGTLKNIYAIAGGILAQLELGDNARAVLLARGIAEMSRFGRFIGSDPLTFMGLSGYGDLIATCLSPHSRNHTVGKRLAQGDSLQKILDTLGMVAEGVNTTEVACRMARKFNISMPLADAVNSILFEGKDTRKAIEALLSHTIFWEIDEYKSDFMSEKHMLIPKNYSSSDLGL